MNGLGIHEVRPNLIKHIRVSASCFVEEKKGGKSKDKNKKRNHQIGEVNSGSFLNRKFSFDSPSRWPGHSKVFVYVCARARVPNHLMIIIKFDLFAIDTRREASTQQKMNEKSYMLNDQDRPSDQCPVFEVIRLLLI